MDEEIANLLRRQEGNRLDFKRSEKLNASDQLAKHLVAFANRYGGKLVFGITDDKSIEGANFNEEEVLSTLRNVARVRCSPPVLFEERFFLRQEGEEESGDVLIVDIYPKDSTPHAVVEGSNNEKRIYYVRSADESRLITDAEELEQLFQKSSDPSFHQLISTCVIHSTRTYEPISLKPQMGGWFDYRELFKNFSSDIHSELERRETKEDESGQRVAELKPLSEEDFGSKIIRESFPHILFHSFRQRVHDFWIRDTVSTDEEYDSYLRYSETIEHDDLNNNGNREAIEDIDLDIEDIHRYWGELLTVPYGTEATAVYPDSDDEPPKLVFEREGKFRVEIAIYHLDHYTILGLPLAYSGKVRSGSDPYTRNYTISISAEFGFPEVEDPEIRINQAFVEGIKNFVIDRWDFDEFQQSLPDSELYRIGEKVDEIEKQLSGLSEQDN